MWGIIAGIAIVIGCFMIHPGLGVIAIGIAVFLIWSNR
jgi:hypothetical protein